MGYELILMQVLPLNLEHDAHPMFRSELAAFRATCCSRADTNEDTSSAG
jgi:hypothetical protein